MSRDESRRSKRSRADRDFDMGPGDGILVNDYDDERTLDEEEALEGSEDTHNELSHLQKESDMPLKELLVMYGYSDMSSQDPNKAEDEEEDEEDEEEEEEDDEDEDDDDPSSYEPDLKQFYTEMVKGEENGANVKRPSTTKTSDPVSVSETNPLTQNINTLPSMPSTEPKAEDNPDMPGNPNSESQNPSNVDINSSMENVNSTAPSSGNVGSGGGGSSRLLRSVSRPQSEEEEDDCDYSPDEEEWKKTIMVGSDYQAAIPEGLCKYDDALPYENEDKMLWDPCHINEDAVEEFLERAQLPIVKGSSLPSGSHVRDDEQALYLLLQCGYNLEEALRRRRMNVLPPTESVSLWSEEECHNFETGLRNYGKDFHLIQKNKVRTRSVGELVQFYYLWKKTERHDIFTYKARLEKKKYALHPGITDYMDRFLEEQEGVRDRSSSPNVHCLLYGDAKRQRTNANSTSNDEPISNKSALDNWDNDTKPSSTVALTASTTTTASTMTTTSSTATTATTTTTTTTTTTSSGDAVTSVNSGPLDPLAVDQHHNLSSPIATGQIDYTKANNATTMVETVATSWPCLSDTTTNAPSSSPQQQRNHLHHRHLQQQTTNTNNNLHLASLGNNSAGPANNITNNNNNNNMNNNNNSNNNNNNNNDNDDEIPAVVTVASRSPENILPHLPP